VLFYLYGKIALIKQKLRNGYTTGSCAAAAAKAASVLLLGGGRLSRSEISLPKGGTLTLRIGELNEDGGRAVCGIKKDSGDDPDVTDGVMVYAVVEKTINPEVEIDGGAGIGRVTKRGLSVPVGKAAINPIPLGMIEREVRQVMHEHGYAGGMKVVISIPSGAELAAKTFNPRLGIEGGLSVLGTTGIVHPMSEQALVDSIRLELNVIRESGLKKIALTPGNYGETFLSQTLKVHGSYITKCSNFVGCALDSVIETGFSQVLLCGHIGKFIKMAGGIFDLHSKHADCRMELLAAYAAAEGMRPETICRLLDCVVMDDALRLLEEADVLKKTMERMTDRIWFYLSKRLEGRIDAGVVIYSNLYGVLGIAGNAQSIIEQMKAEAAAD